jgi:hypothetical protein
MSVDTVFGNIQLAPFEPLAMAGFEIAAVHGVPRLPPRKMGGNFRPKRMRIGDAALIIAMITF